MTKDSDTANLGLRKLGGDVSLTLLRQGLAIVLGLGLSITLARVLGPEGNGQYAMVILLPTLLATFFNLGIAPSNVYHIASEKVKPRDAFKTTFGFWTFLSTIGIIIGIAIIFAQSSNWFPGVPSYLLWIGIVAYPIALFQQLLGSFFQGLQDFKKYNSVLLVPPGLTLLLAIVLVVFLEMGVWGALISFIVGHFLGLLVTFFLLKPHIDKDSANTKSRNYAKDCIKYGYKAHLSNIITFVNYRADIFLVNFFLNPAATGIYVVAVQIAERLWTLSSSVSTVILPRLSELSKDELKRKNLTPLVARWVLLVSAVGAIFMALLAPNIIPLLYGNEYLDAIGVLLWLLPGIIFGSMFKILGNDIAARGKPEINLYISVFTVTINIVANIILIPNFGIKGAAFATTLSYSFDAIIKLFVYSYISKNPWWAPILFNQEDKRLFYEGFSLIKKAVIGKIHR
jgi:O-antigen/teichoic acid export membrane protein